MIAFEPQRKETYLLTTSGKSKAKIAGPQEPSLLVNAKCDKSQMLAHCYFLRRGLLCIKPFSLLAAQALINTCITN